LKNDKALKRKSLAARRLYAPKAPNAGHRPTRCEKMEKESAQKKKENERGYGERSKRAPPFSLLIDPARIQSKKGRKGYNVEKAGTRPRKFRMQGRKKQLAHFETLVGP